MCGGGLQEMCGGGITRKALPAGVRLTSKLQTNRSGDDLFLIYTSIDRKTLLTESC